METAVNCKGACTKGFNISEHLPFGLDIMELWPLIRCSYWVHFCINKGFCSTMSRKHASMWLAVIRGVGKLTRSVMFPDLVCTQFRLSRGDSAGIML